MHMLWIDHSLLLHPCHPCPGSLHPHLSLEHTGHLLLISPTPVPFSILLPIILAKSVSHHINSLSKQNLFSPGAPKSDFLAKLVEPAVFCTQAVFLLFSLNSLRPRGQNHTLFSRVFSCLLP